MPRQPDLPFALYVLDADALIRLKASKRLAQLRNPGRSILIPERVRNELRRAPGWREWLETHRDNISGFVAQESDAYLTLLRQEHPKVHDGEAAAIAIAMHRRNATLVSEDKAARQKAQHRGVPVATTQEFLQQWWPSRPHRQGEPTAPKHRRHDG